MRNEILALLAMAMLITGGALAGCPPAGGDDDDDDDDACGNTVVEWSCGDGVCYCDSGPNQDDECTDPDETTADDSDNCDNYCEWCDE